MNLVSINTGFISFSDKKRIHQQKTDESFFVYITILEVNFGVVITALQQLFHLFDGWLARIGAGACVSDGIDCDIMQAGEEDIFRDETLFGRVRISAVILDAVRDVQVVVHLAQIGDQCCDLFIIGSVLCPCNQRSRHSVSLRSHPSH